MKGLPKDNGSADAPLTHIKNSPPAPPPTLQQALCRRRRRSDLLLMLIGISICILSVLHIAWHSDSLPHSHHVKNSTSQLTLKGKSALQQKLDEFIDARGKASGKTFRTLKASKGDSKVPLNLKAEAAKAARKYIHRENITSEVMKNDGNNNGNPKKMDQKPLPLSKNKQEEPHPVAHLNCADHGGPNNQQIVDGMGQYLCCCYPFTCVLEYH